MYFQLKAGLSPNSSSLVLRGVGGGLGIWREGDVVLCMDFYSRAFLAIFRVCFLEGDAMQVEILKMFSPGYIDEDTWRRLYDLEFDIHPDRAPLKARLKKLERFVLCEHHAGSVVDLSHDRHWVKSFESILSLAF